MHHRIAQLALLLASASGVILLSPSCGEDDNARFDSFTPLAGQGVLPGTVGRLGGPGSEVSFLPGDLPTPLADPGSQPFAQLGLAAEHAPRAGSAVVMHVGDGSAQGGLAPGESFRLLWVAVTPAGVPPEPVGQQFVLTEGDSVELWAAYLAAADVTLARRWSLSPVGLDFTEQPELHAAAGEYRARLEYILPVGSAAPAAVYGCEALDAAGDSLGHAETAEQIEQLAGLFSTHYPFAGGAYQLNWEDLLDTVDFDYNDFVCNISATELYHSGETLKQVTLTVKALARGSAGVTGWQLNLNSVFPGARAVATLSQYADDGDGDRGNDTLRASSLWTSSDGVALPVFPQPQFALGQAPTANVIPGTDYFEGDYTIVRILFDGAGVAAGSYPLAPYHPELRVEHGGQVYSYPLWQAKGDAVLSSGMPRGGFAMPGGFPWALEHRRMGSAYSGWNDWAAWLKQPASEPPPDPAWYTEPPVANTFARTLFN
jgi:hypothetical protein